MRGRREEYGRQGIRRPLFVVKESGAFLYTNYKREPGAPAAGYCKERRSDLFLPELFEGCVRT